MSKSNRKDNKRLAKRIRTAKAAALLIVLILVLTLGEIADDPSVPSWSSVFSDYVSTSSVSPSDAVVHIIDVGQGDCMLVQSGEYDILIDAGENGMGEKVCDYLRATGVRQLDWIIATHPHSDHMGGMDDVIENIGADNILMVYIPEEHSIDNSFYLSVLDAIEANGVDVAFANEGDIFTFGELTVEVLHPTYGEYRDDINDLSICTVIRCGDFGVVACGDITYEVEEELLAEEHDIRADVFVANHHGSALSNSEEFITAIAPQYTIFSCGQNNSYGHPHNSILKLLDRLGIPYYRTDRSGTIVISYIDGSIEIETEK